MKYSYPSYTACMQDPYPKCSVTYSNTANTYCTGIVDVTPTGTCFSDNTYNNVMYTSTSAASDDYMLSGGAIAGIVIGCVVFAILICVAIFLMIRCMKGGSSSSSSG